MRPLRALCLMTALTGAALAIIPATDFAAVARAESVSEVTNYDVLIRMLEKNFPDTARKIREKFEKIDKSDKSSEDKHADKHLVLRKEYQKLNELKALATADGKRALEEAQAILDYMNTLHIRFGLRFAAADTAVPAKLKDQFKATLTELEEQRKREAELNKGDGIAPEHSSLGGGDSGFSFALGGGFGMREPKGQSYLATEVGENLTLGVIDMDRDTDVAFWDMAIRYAGEFTGLRMARRDDVCDCDDCDECDERFPRVTIEALFGGSSGSDRQNIDDFDGPSGVGTALGIPGTGDPSSTFPAGIALSGLGNTDVTDIHARYEFDSYYAGLRFGYEFEWAERFSITPFLGTGYVYTSERQSFGGSVPGFGQDFEYDTKVTLDTFKLDFGANLEYGLSDTFSVFAEPSFSMNFICVDGWDRLDLSGLATDSQQVDLDEKETLPGVRLVVGFDWEPEGSPISLYVGARVAHEPDSAVVERSGETGEQSEVDVKYSTSYGIAASISYKF